MEISAPDMFEKAVEEAQSYVGRDDKLQGLLHEASGKAEQHHDFLVEAWESLQIFLRVLRSWLTGKYFIPAASLLMITAALIYFVNPLDLIPDSIPVLGLLDDAAVISFVARGNIGALSRFRNWEASGV